MSIQRMRQRGKIKQNRLDDKINPELQRLSERNDGSQPSSPQRDLWAVASLNRVG